ncbi:MAG: nitrate reductase [wastewater metagenome]|nr:nitrate reductase [Candidatus Loosdrechtia aerotolerans]
MSIQWKKSTCPYCGLGCGVTVGVENGKIISVQGIKDHPANYGDLCTLIRNYPPLFNNAEDRLTQPKIRHNNILKDVCWDEAITYAANELNRIKKEHGPDSIAFYCGAASFSEEYYVINKLMKGCIGTNNVECTSRLCMASTAMGFISTFGADAPPTCYADIEEADLFLIAGNNMAVSVPVLFSRIRAAKKKNNARIIVIDPRRTETASLADIHLQVKPGTDVALNNALAYILLKEGFVQEENVERFSTGIHDLKLVLEEYPPSRVAAITGCTEKQIYEVAYTIGRARAMLTFWFQGYNQSTQAVFKNNTLHNLSLLTNNFCRPGAGPLSITGEANSLGSRWIGVLSHLLPGMRYVTNHKHRQEIAHFWNVPVEKIHPAPGRSIIDIVRGLHSGEIRALWVMASNPAASLPDTRWVKEGLKKAELLIVQDIFHPTETTALANVILAGAQWCEKTGTFITSERRVELAEKIIDPPGEAKPDYEIVCRIARAMGFQKEFPYASPDEIFEELKKITSGRICDMNGVSYERLCDKTGPQLPCPRIQHPGTPRLFTDFHYPRPDGRAALLARNYAEPAEPVDNEYPFILITGRLAHQFNTGTRTGRIKRLNDIEPHNYVEIHPADVCRLGITEGEEVEIVSRRGSIRCITRIKDRVPEGCIHINLCYGNSFLVRESRGINFICNAACDVHSKQPEFKYCAVKVTKVPKK